MILKKNGEVFVFGSNDIGEIGMKDETDINKPTLLMKGDEISEIFCGYKRSFILKKNRELNKEFRK